MLQCIFCTMLLVFSYSVKTVAMQTEDQFYESRKSTIQKAYCDYLGADVSKVMLPKIGIALSGGGFRALIESSGFLEAISELGLWDATSCIAALSGSVWGLGAYLAAQQVDPKFSSADLSRLIKKNISRKLLDESIFLNADFEKILTEKRAAGQEIGVVDLWGELILNKLLGDMKGHEQLRFSELAPDSQKSPFPLFTSTIDFYEKSNSWWNWAIAVIAGFAHKYELMEISPFKTQCDCFTQSISTNLLNSYFEKYKLLEQKPEPTLSYLFGVCGSAFCISWQDVFNFIQDCYLMKKPKGLFAMFCEEALDEIKDSIVNGRVCPAQVFNFAYDSAILGSDKYLTVGDGGLIANIPLLPLLKRNMDVILVCDASAGAEKGEFKELTKAVAFAQKRGYKTPSLKKPYWARGNVKVFGDPQDKSIPTIIYFKCDLDTTNKYGTLKLEYTADEFDDVHGKIKAAVQAAKTTIKTILLRKAYSMKP